MKRNIICALLALALMGSIVDIVLAAPLKDGFDGLALTLQSSQPSYVLGELVKLKIKVANKTGQAVSLSGAPDVWTGAVKVFIASGEGPFKEYFGPGWGLRCVMAAPQVEISPGGSIETAAAVLYNHRMETRQLSEMYVREINRKRLGTDYAFVRPGVYRLKAVLQKEDRTLESEALEIEIREPQGADRSIWEVLREDPELGFFVQTGSPKSSPETPRSQQLKATLERLVGSFPEGRQVEGILASLAEYHALLESLRASQMQGVEPFDEE